MKTKTAKQNEASAIATKTYLDSLFLQLRRMVQETEKIPHIFNPKPKSLTITVEGISIKFNADGTYELF